MPVSPDPYTVLGVSREAPQSEVRSAFRALVRRYHPDTSEASETSDAELRLVLAAYRILRDPTSRSSYDLAHPAVTIRHSAPRPAAAPNGVEVEVRRRPTRMPRWAAPRASDLFLADPFYASSFFADPHVGDSYFVRIIR
jgi:curved DNA-binding protein CbpA